MYIIIWRHNTRESFVDVDSRGFINLFYNVEDAIESAEETLRNENVDSRSEWYFNYKIYKEI
jgi:hypothetical protein